MQRTAIRSPLIVTVTTGRSPGQWHEGQMKLGVARIGSFVKMKFKYVRDKYWSLVSISIQKKNLHALSTYVLHSIFTSVGLVYPGFCNCSSTMYSLRSRCCLGQPGSIAVAQVTSTFCAAHTRTPADTHICRRSHGGWSEARSSKSSMWVTRPIHVGCPPLPLQAQ